jgi:hypothetical protein
MHNNECNNDNYVELKYNNDYIFLDNVPNEDYITINKINDVFTHIYLHNKSVNIENSVLKKNKVDEDINNYNYILNHHSDKNMGQSLFFYDENENIFLEKNIRVDKLNDDFKITKSSIFKKNIEECYVDEDIDSKNQITSHKPYLHAEYKEQEELITIERQNITQDKLNNDADEEPMKSSLLLSGETITEKDEDDDVDEGDDGDEDNAEEEDINNQITEYKEELLMIETEIKIINNIIFNIKASNDKSIFNLNKFKTRIFNKKNCDTLLEQIKILSERKKMIENTINDIYKLMKTYEK